jgi:hypothetical protein
MGWNFVDNFRNTHTPHPVFSWSEIEKCFLVDFGIHAFRNRFDPLHSIANAIDCLKAWRKQNKEKGLLYFSMGFDATDWELELSGVGPKRNSWVEHLPDDGLCRAICLALVKATS